MAHSGALSATVALNRMWPSAIPALYWGLPTPADFVRRVASQTRQHRATVLSLTRHQLPGIWEQVKDGLARAEIPAVVDLNIHDGTDIAYEVGPHFECAFLTAAKLAETSARELTAVLLRPKGDYARRNCESYFRAFLDALAHAGGNTYLLVEIADGEITEDSSAEGFQVLAFDGAISSDEMAAYVGLRMLGRNGPGSTKLLRSLVYEYSGFDVALAERLVALPDSDILGLPRTLGALLEADPLRWQKNSWLEGTAALVDGRELRHPLREWYLALHSGSGQEGALMAAKRRYWRACVQTLTPWLEERRLQVLDIFKRPLDVLLGPTGGKHIKPLPSGKTIEIERNELEYNNIVGMTYFGELAIPGDPRSQQAFAVCKVAKAVRDDLAHLRAPKSQDVLSLISTMDSLLT